MSNCIIYGPALAYAEIKAEFQFASQNTSNMAAFNMARMSRATTHTYARKQDGAGVLVHATSVI